MRRLVLIGLLAACGDDGASIPIEQYEQASINAYCNKFVDCGLVDDLATCHTLDLSIPAASTIVAAVRAGKIIYRGDKARECLDAISGTCERLAFHGIAPLACSQIFEGTVPANGTCAFEQECISNECAVQGCQGTCIGNEPPLGRPRVNESCANGATCLDSFCDPVTTTCTAYRANGSACTGAQECANNACNNLVCGSVPKTGEACDPSASPACRDVGDTCNATSKTCVPFGLTGDACSTDVDCAPLYTCGVDSTCHLRSRLGDPCDGQNIASCIDRSWCDPTTQQCTALKADGLVCTSGEECVSGTCDSDQCVTPEICI